MDVGATSVTVADLHFGYGASSLLRGISLHARSGEVLGILGSNGAGKTTILRLMAGLLTPQSGQVQVGGQDQVAIGGGPSKFGELFYCEAPTITGPWRACDRIITHNVTGASCYNPLQLPWLDEEGGNVLYIACTWTSMSSGGDGPNDRACDYDMYGGQHCAVAVPRYEYNNVVFRLNVTRDLPHLPHLAQE